MKSIILCLSFVLLVSLANSQPSQKDSLKTDSAVSATPVKGQSDLIWVRESDIPPSALINLQRDAKILDVEEDLEKIGEYVSIGREIGGAIDTSLSAIAYHADNISKTFVGKFTMLMIAWKVMGSDLVDKIFDVLVLIGFSLVWIWSFRKNFGRRKIVTKVEITPWFWIFRRRRILETKDYEPGEKDHNVCGNNCTKSCEVKESKETSYWVHILIGIIVFIILFLVTVLG
ncbi:MAG TPA: hypothetical protein PKI61_03320 [bacterium]|nr:hypothetical protein [bacterium]HPT29559.1 hypothetical protein [bacterium]